MRHDFVTDENTGRLIRSALEEDGAWDDITSAGMEFGPGRVKAAIIAKEGGILCGTEVAVRVFREISSETAASILIKDGSRVKEGDNIMVIEGAPADILAAERTALNFLSHMSGVSTLTSRFAEAARKENPRCRIMDTRKTLPGFRILDKYAVRTGGGFNHRMDLSEHVLIKENHLFAAGRKIGEVISVIREKTPRKVTVELEVENLKQLEETVNCGPDIVLLDDFSLEDIKKARSMVDRSAPGMQIEVSGGVNLDNVAEIAAAGADRISVGAITHSAAALDFSLIIKNG
ncbi:MAG: carboxylating nicotinate-nucleotide diphosphorylase [Elusimicrobia bacterium]|nr:carboxylating nicotinate-nucleotide diphosphorylase [Elusimicrobiota bacterium]